MAAQSTIIGMNRFGLSPLLHEVPTIDAAHSILMADAESASEVALFTGVPSTQDSLKAMLAKRAIARARKDEMSSQAEGNKAMNMRELPAELQQIADERLSLEKELRFTLRATRKQQSGFGERLVLYWANHFTISSNKGKVKWSIGPYVREVVRPYMLARFEQLLFAATTHPAMLFYLDNAGSIGPGSAAGKRRERGLNENLAREVLELHSLGVDGGYTQQDVTALAKILTGWTVDLDPRSATCGTAIFVAQRHEPGAKELMGHRIDEAGRDELVKAIGILAAHPSTARNVARRLVASFLSDSPSADSIEAVQASFNRTGGDLRAVTQQLIAIEAMWTMPPLKIRSPLEMIYVTDRLLGETPMPPDLTVALAAMGQPYLKAPSPKGWTEDNDGWLSSDGIKSRLDWASVVGAKFGDLLDTIAWADAASSGSLSADTADAVRRAESKDQAMALLLMSPEFQRR